MLGSRQVQRLTARLGAVCGGDATTAAAFLNLLASGCVHRMPDPHNQSQQSQTIYQQTRDISNMSVPHIHHSHCDHASSASSPSSSSSSLLSSTVAIPAPHSPSTLSKRSMASTAKEGKVPTPYIVTYAEELKALEDEERAEEEAEEREADELNRVGGLMEEVSGVEAGARHASSSSFQKGKGGSSKYRPTADPDSIIYDVDIPVMSGMFIPTLHSPPAEATLKSHQLLLRAGYMRQLSAGHYMMLPLGMRVLDKIEVSYKYHAILCMMV